ncbi:MAG: hypothetical protein ACN6O0_03825 [Achromobacter spanius]
MSWQASVQARQAPAQIWQCSTSWYGAQARAQASQTKAHSVQSAVENSPLRANMAAQRRQTLAQSVARLMQRFIRVALVSKHPAAHSSQATAHS